MIGLLGHDDRRCRQWNDRVVARWLAQAHPDLTPVDPVAHFVATTVLDLSLSPGGPRDRQLRYGEPFDVLETRDGRAFGSALHANYVGWVDAEALRPEGARHGETTSVGARATHVYPEPSLKTKERMALPHLATVLRQRTEAAFTLTELGWIPSVHLRDELAVDPVSVAALYLGTPYLWGGNSSCGIDCSGLVQAALFACGIACPGDSDLQEAALGETLPEGTPPQRGDLLFWTGHVAWVSDPHTILHANAHAMAVSYEPLQDAVARIAAQGGGPVTRHARLS